MGAKNIMASGDLNNWAEEIYCPISSNKKHYSDIEEPESSKLPEHKREDFCETQCPIYKMNHILKKKGGS